MSNYTQQVSWSGKDALSTSDPEKIISGDDLSTEFTAVQTAINSKMDVVSGTTTGQTLVSPIINTSISGTAVLDEDDLVSDSSTKLATQQSIKAYADAHITDTSAHGVTGAIVGISDAQTLTNKTVVAASNTITTAASGNLTSTELNAALAELQTDVDTKTTLAAATAATAADVILTNADVVTTNANVVATNADVVTTTQDAIDTAADAASTAADAISTAADAVSTAADVVTTAANASNASASADAAAASAAGIFWKEPVTVRSTDNLTLSGEQTIDGVLTSASRVLVMDQSSGAENGVYVTASGAWARAAPLDTWDEFVGATLIVNQGTAYANQAYLCTVTPGGTLDTTAITWAPFGSVATGYSVDSFADSADYTSGTTTQLTMSSDPASKNNIIVTFDGVTQHHNTYSVSGTTLTFSSPIPLGTTTIEIRFGTSLGIGTPSDGTVTSAKLSGDLVAPGALTVTGEAVATGFTGTLDGILGGGTPAAATVTTLTASDDLTFSGANPNIVGGDTDGRLLIAGGNGVAVGGYMILFGDTHVSQANDVLFASGGGNTRLLFDNGALTWDFQANAITTTGTLSAGATTFAGTTNNGDNLLNSLQLGTGRSAFLERNVASAVRPVVAVSQSSSTGGTQAALAIRQADTGEIALGINTDGSTSSYNYSIDDLGNVTSTGTLSAGATTIETAAETTLYINNTGTSNSVIRHRIGGSTKAVAGVLRADSSYRIAPSNIGTSDHLIIENATGNATFAGLVIKPAQPAFLAYNSVTDSNVTGTNATGFYKVDFDTEVFDQGGDFSADTFTAPVTGRYQFEVNVSYQGITSTADEIILQLVTSNRTYENYTLKTNDLPAAGVARLSVLADMDASDTAFVNIKVREEASDVVDISGGANMPTFFSGYLVA